VQSTSEIDAAVARAAAAGGEEKRAYVRRIFSEIAPRYDLLNHVLSLNIDRRWRRTAVEAMQWRRKPHGAYLDLCAGTLDVAVMLAGEGDFRGRVIGADFALPMLRAGRSKADGLPVSPLAADALELPLADGSVDGAIIAFGVRNLASLEAGFREVLRVLAPGGRLVVLEFSSPTLAPVRAAYGFYMKHVLPRVGGAVSGHPSAYEYLPESVARFPAGDELADVMRSAGFKSVEWRALTLGIAAVHAGNREPGTGNR
jgi:demethylmenaquinone methyltransferase / 2-methoxy-6-polyprenyl-1,4-benzoquinol methylase